MGFANSVKIINNIFLGVLSSLGWPLYCAYPLLSKFSRTKLSRMAGNMQKLRTLKPMKIKAHTVVLTSTSLCSGASCREAMLIDQAQFLKSEMRKLDRSRYTMLCVRSPLYAFSTIEFLCIFYMHMACFSNTLM